MRNAYVFMFILLTHFGFSQKPKAYFESDSLSIGKPIAFSLTFLHSGKTDLLFPDSTSNFKPFELVDIDYFPTKTQGGRSLDSVVYKLITFKVDTSYSLSLPVQSIRSKTKIFSNIATVKLKSSLDSQDFKNPIIKKSTGYFDVPLDFNFPKFLYYVVVLLISVGLFWALFGKIIYRSILVWRFNQKQQKFATAYKKLSKTPKNFKNIENGLVLWKNHLEWLLKKPYSTMTTSEITKTLENERLDEALKEFDQAIYGGILSDHIPFAFNILFDFAANTFKNQRKIYKEELKSGRG
ncbi:hypothetical protein [Lacihabitans soyangensis]|nr:hypothetical protein [Lacihabitans soyangensis]